MKKRMLSLLLALMLVIGLLPVTARAEMLDNGLMYELYENHVKITGYTGNATELVIPTQIEGLPVTVIGDNAFNWCNTLITIDIPDSVTHIGERVFWGCYSLTDIPVDPRNPNYTSLDGILYSKDMSSLICCPSGKKGTVDIPEGVTIIGDSAFQYCFYLSNIHIPDSVTVFGPSAFEGCESLTNLSIPASVTNIMGNSTFWGCINLTEVLVDPGNDYYTSSNGILYDKDKSTLICCPAGKTGTIEIPDGITTIASAAFMDCSHLTNISIPDTVHTIYDQAFSSCCSLTSISLPNGISSIGFNTFYNCSSLTRISIPEGVTFIDDQAFTYCFGLTDVSIPDSVTHIGDYAFDCCSSLTSIFIPDSVTYIGDSPFSGCENLTGIYVDENNPNYFSDDQGILFNKDRTLLIQAPGAIAGSCVIPYGVISISDRAFSCCDNLIEISIPNSVSSIGRFALSDCENLTTVNIPDSVSFIDYGNFNYCFNLKTVYFEGSAPDIGGDIFYFHDAIPSTIAYYPASDPSWTAEVMRSYSRIITWIGYNPEGSFYDVQMDSWYEAPVEWAVEKGITTGATATTFNPGGSCLRAHVVTFLWRAAGSPAPQSSANPFVDVKPGDFYYDAVLWAVENGITSGIDATHFDPAGVCNRVQVVTFLYRAFGSPSVENTGNPFADIPGDAWFSAPVVWAIEHDITQGLSATEFGPTNPCIRAQVVTFLYRSYN